MKISIIIPVYNKDKYLKPCLDSILKQTLDDFEVICVDDGSTDNSLKILKNYEKKDKRIKVLHQKNLHAGIARNNGLKISKGEYILFLDADDFFDEKLCEITYQKAKENNADIVVFNGIKYDETNNTYEPNPFISRKAKDFPKVFNLHKVPDRIYNFATTGPCNKIYRRAFLEKEKLEFPNLQNAEDVYFVLLALTLAKRICFIDDVLLNYRVGLTDNLQSLNKDQDAVIYAYRSVYDELHKRNLYNIVEKSFVRATLSSINYNLASVIKQEEGLKVFYNTLNSPVFLDMNLLTCPYSYYKPKKFYYPVVYHLMRTRYLKERDQRVKYIVKKKSQASHYKVSVIVPIYNVELYLEECLDSLVKQTLKDIEIICVNDASKDKSLDISLKYAKKYKNITIIDHVINGGLSIARNSGLKEAKGEYIYFLDSDDYIEDKTLEECYNLAHKNNLDSVYFDTYLLVDGEVDEELVKDHRRYYERKGNYPSICNGSDLFVKLSKNRECCVSACTQIAKKNFLINKDLWFHEDILHEDEPFFLMTFLLANKVGYIHKSFYHRRLRPDSIMTTKFNFRNVYGKFIDYCELAARVGTVDLTPEQEEYVSKKVKSLLLSTRQQYRKISSKEKKKYLELDTYEKYLFKYLIVYNSYGIVHIKRAIERRIRKLLKQEVE